MTPGTFCCKCEKIWRYCVLCNRDITVTMRSSARDDAEQVVLVRVFDKNVNNFTDL